MISFSNINKQYGKQLLFVDASFQLDPGREETPDEVRAMPRLYDFRMAPIETNA